MRGEMGGRQRRKPGTHASAVIVRPDDGEMPLDRKRPDVTSTNGPAKQHRLDGGWGRQEHRVGAGLHAELKREPFIETGLLAWISSTIGNASTINAIEPPTMIGLRPTRSEKRQMNGIDIRATTITPNCSNCEEVEETPPQAESGTV